MSDIAKFSEEQIADGLRDLPEWAEVGETIQRTYLFRDFVTSMRFVAAVGQHAEQVQHHPDMLIRYTKVTLTLATHDAGGITAKDFESARAYDSLAAALPTPAAPPPTPSKAARAKKK